MPRIIVVVVLIAMGSSAALGDARQDCEQRRGEEQIAACSQAIQENPRDAISYTNRGIAQYNEYDKSIADFTKAIEIDPNNARAYYYRGEAHRNRKLTDKRLVDYERTPKESYFRPAIADYTKAIEFNSTYVNAYMTRGNIYREIGDFELAIADYTRVIEIDPANVDAYAARGDTHTEKGDFELAIVDFSRVVNIDPRRGWLELGLARFYSGDFHGAGRDFSKSVEVGGGGKAILFRYLAKTHSGESAENELEQNSIRFPQIGLESFIIEFYLGKRDVGQLVNSASDTLDRCRANFYIGEKYLLRGNKAEAAEAFKASAKTCKSDTIEYSAAKFALRRIRQ